MASNEDSQGYPKLDNKAARALAPHSFTIRIDSILGGVAPYSSYSTADQHVDLMGIDPDTPYSSATVTTFGTAPGILFPMSNQPTGQTTTGAPLWFVSNPKNATIYVYDSVGSVYTLNTTTAALVGLGDLNDGGSSHGNGAEYYDNYVYFCRDTTVARYGPLDGTPSFTDDYWTGTLGKAALTNPAYPTNQSLSYPNHVMNRHTDGKLYFGDVVGNQGVLHCISTTKAAVEGDTDNGSTFNAIDFPFGQWPTAVTSIGDRVCAALFEGLATATNTHQSRAKIVFWDPTNPLDVDSKTDKEFPDPFISALVNSNGIGYVFSGDNFATLNSGVRVTRIVSPTSFEEVALLDTSYPPFPGAVDGILNKIFFGGVSLWLRKPSLWTLGLKKSSVQNALFNIMSSNGMANSAFVTAAKVLPGYGLNFQTPIVGTWNGLSTSTIDFAGSSSNPNSVATFISQMFRLGQPFKITKITIPLLEGFSSAGTQQLDVNVFIDNNITPTSVVAATYAKYGTSKRLVLRPTNMTGLHSFNLYLYWDEAVPLIVHLPITIEGEFLDD